MTNAELCARAHELDEAATPGPWHAHWEEVDFVDIVPDCWSVAADGSRHHYYGDDVITGSPSAADATFIAESRSLLPALATAVETLEATLKAHRILWRDAEKGETEAEALNARLVAALRNLMDSPVEWDGPTTGYVTVQMDNTDRKDARALLADLEPRP